MGEKYKYLNPSLNEMKSPKEVKRPSPRKLHDVKIPLPEQIDYMLRLHSRKGFSGSKTALGTHLFLQGLHHIVEYRDFPYDDERIMTHLKISQEDYERLSVYSSEWKVSQRRAAHRIFINAYIREFGVDGHGL